MAKITDPKDIKYLALEGGGGKGFAYLGAILALEELKILPINNAGDNYMDTLEEFGLLPIDPKKKRILGISGASAGSITALMLAMGLTSSQIKQELSSPPGKFNAFFDKPKPNFHRKVTSSNTQDYYTNPHEKNRTLAQAKINSIIELAKTSVKFVSSCIETPFIIPITSYKIVGFLMKKPKSPQNAIVEQVFNKGKLGEYILNLVYDFGLFPGFKVRDYFTKLVGNYIKDDRLADEKFKRPNYPASQLPFREFANKTGIDLIVTGTNVTLHRPKLFSKELTPDFPVVESVGISMNLPLLFKPVYVDSLDNNYKGFWCDGGVLNNLPIHAFDKPGESLNPDMLALRLTPGEHPYYEKNKSKFEKVLKKINKNDLSSDDKNNSILERFFNYFSDLWETFTYPSEEGQIRFPAEAEQTIHLYTFDLSLTEFSPPINKQLLPVLFAHKSIYDYFGRKWNPQSEVPKIVQLIDPKQ